MLRIDFDCVTTFEAYPYVNTITFRLKDGREITVDRDSTAWDSVGSNMYWMQWNACYAWDGETMDYDLTKNMFYYAEIIDIDIEDEAPEEWSIEINSFDVSDTEEED